MFKADLRLLQANVSLIHAQSNQPKANVVVHKSGDPLPNLPFKFYDSGHIANLVVLLIRDVYIVLENISVTNNMILKRGHARVDPRVMLYSASPDYLDWNDLLKDASFISVLSHFFPGRNSLVVKPCSKSSNILDISGLVTSLLVTSGLLFHHRLPLQNALSTEAAFIDASTCVSSCLNGNRPVKFDINSSFYTFDYMGDFINPQLKEEASLSSVVGTTFEYTPVQIPSDTWQLVYEPAGKPSSEPVGKPAKLPCFDDDDDMIIETQDQLRNDPALLDKLIEKLTKSMSSDEDEIPNVDNDSIPDIDEDMLNEDLPVFDCVSDLPVDQCIKPNVHTTHGDTSNPITITPVKIVNRAVYPVTVKSCKNVEKSDPATITPVKIVNIAVGPVTVTSCKNADTINPATITPVKIVNRAVDVDTSINDSAVNTTDVIVGELIPCKELGPHCRRRIKPSFAPVTHYHCTNCNTYSQNSKKRVLEHIQKCRAKDSVPCLEPCQQRGGTCPPRIHYHCTVEQCSYRQFNKKHVLKHMETQHQPKSSPATTETPKPTLQVQLVCQKSSIFLVRNRSTGVASPVHVKLTDKSFKCSGCYDTILGDVPCVHVSACRNYIKPPYVEDLVENKDNFSEFDDQETLSKYFKIGKYLKKTICASFVPANKDSRYCYFSVYDYANYNECIDRRLVTLDRDSKKTSCECNKQFCVHRKLVSVALGVDDLIRQKRDTLGNDSIDLKNIERAVNYLLQNKRIPIFDSPPAPKLIADIAGNMTVLKHFSPREKECKYCCKDLVFHEKHSKGIIFVQNGNRVENVSVSTKICPTCSLVYRYSETDEGYFNFNNTSFFTIRLMEYFLYLWLNGTPLDKQVDAFQQNGFDICNIGAFRHAMRVYISLLDFDFSANMSCLRCGYYPPVLTYDTIRKTCFKMKPSDLKPVSEGYTSFDDMISGAQKLGIALSLIPDSQKAKASEFKMNLTQSLPPLISPHNEASLQESTRDKVLIERPEESPVSMADLERLLKGPKTSEKLRTILKTNQIQTAGGLEFMIQRVLGSENEPDSFKKFQKEMFSLQGKSGGILRAFCPHGVCYALKLLTLSESVSDYTNVLTYFKVPPTVNISDMASMIAVHTNNHFPNFFRPNLGQFAEPGSNRAFNLKYKVDKHSFDLSCTREIGTGKRKMTDSTPVYSVFDRFHQFNHNEPNMFLRSLDYTDCTTTLNSSVVEQKNSELGKLKPSLNSMSPETFTTFMTLLTVKNNMKVNKKWTRSRIQAGFQLSIDSAGRLTEHVSVKPSTLNTNKRPANSNLLPVKRARIDYTLLGESNSGRKQLNNSIRDIMYSSDEWYDNVIINSYSEMCVRATGNNIYSVSPEYIYDVENLPPRRKPFVQIVLENRNHWICISNVLSDSTSVDLFDSYRGDSYQLSSLLARFILHLQPTTTSVNIVDTPQQPNSDDCGPWALSNFWALCNKRLPSDYPFITASKMRENVRISFESDSFVAPTETEALFTTKTVLEVFKLTPRHSLIN